MKTVKHLSVLLAVLLVASLLVVGFVVNAEEPVVITVTNEEEFAAAMVEANASATIVLANDITLTNGNTTMPGTFTGTFDGKGYTVSGLTNTLFNKIAGATIKDATFDGAIVSENRKAATVAYDEENNAVIKNVTSYVDITMTASDLNAGGIVGYGKSLTFENVVYAGDYVATWAGAGAGIGGIIGYTNNNGTANYINCAFTGTMTVKGEGNGTLDVGAVIGIARNGTNNFVNCVNLGTFTIEATATANNIAAVAGRNRDNSATIAIKNCVNLGTINEGFTVADAVANGNEGTVEGVYNATTAVKSGTITIGDVAYDQYNFGWLNPTTGAILPITVAEDGTYMVGSGEALAAVFATMTANTNITLTADVTLPEGTPTVNLDYAGTFDGANYTINGISNTMFKKIVGGTVKNVTLNGTIDYVTNTPTIEARKASTLAGDAKNVTLTNVICNVNVTTTASDLNAGGIIGYANEATFTNCTYAGTYTASGDGAVGGIAGYIRTNSGKNVYTDCAFTGTINFNGVASGKTAIVGGLVGKHRQAEVEVVNFTNTGVINVTGIEGTAYVGGFMGNDNDVATLTMSGLFDGTINATGATVDNFLAFDENNKADLTGCVTKNAFSAGTVTVDKNAFVIATDDLSAFISVRDGAAEGTKDYRFIIAADLEKFATYENANLILTFTKDGEVVASATKNILADLDIYASATAAGNTYVAAEGDILTGIVVTDVPADAWDTVTVTVVDGETTLATGNVKNADVAPQTLYTITENTIDLNEVEGAVYSIDIEEHHEQHNYNPAFVVCIDNAAIYKDIYSGGYNPNYTWYLSVNGGAEFIPASFSEYDGGEWGYLRAELGADYATVGEFNITLAIVDNATGNAVYCSEFYIYYDFYYDETKPDGITAIAPEDITVTAGPDLDGNEGAKKAFDGKHNTKVCTGNVGADNALIVELKNTFSLVGVGICNANDNEGNSGRTVLDFEIYVSADGTTWGDAVYVATAGDKNKADYSTNFQEMYHAFAAAVDAKFVKVVVNNDGLYQISDVFLYVGEAEDTPVEVPVPDVTVIEVSNYGIENHHADIKNHAAWVINTGDFALATDIADGKYYVVVYVDGKAKTIVDYSVYGTNWVRLDLETAGVTGIIYGTKMTLQAVVYDTATGAAVCKTNEFEVTSNVFASDAPTYAVDLPSGITQLKVVEAASDDRLANWGDGKDEYLFDGGYGISQVGGTKIGGGVETGAFTMTFSLEAPATVTYYTFITGRDSNGSRNPKAWILYGKDADGNWVVLHNVDPTTAPTGMGKTNSRAYSYKTANPGEYKDYKIEFTTEGQFQMDELVLFADDATAGINKLALVGGMEYVPFHTRGDFAAETYEFRLTCKSEGGHFNQETIAKTTAEGAYVYVKDTTNGGEYVKYEIANLRTDRWCDFYITLADFTPVAGVEYEVIFVFVGAEGSKCAGDIHYMTTTGLKLAQ